MKTLRILSAVVFIFGLLYVGAGLFSLYHYRDTLALFAQYGVSDEVQLSIPEVAQTRATLIGAFIEFSIIGIVVSSNAIALFCAHRWSRRTWLWVVSLLVLFHVGRLVLDFRLGSFLFLERIAELLLISLMAALSWRWLTREPVIAAFRAHSTRAT